LSQGVGIDLNPFFNQYLRDVRIPTLEYYFKDNKLAYRWTNCVSGFDMPVKVVLNGEEKWLNPKTDFSFLKHEKGKPNLVIEENFYVLSKQN
jgi:hypothetical protein